MLRVIDRANLGIIPDCFQDLTLKELHESRPGLLQMKSATNGTEGRIMLLLKQSPDELTINIVQLIPI